MSDQSELVGELAAALARAQKTVLAAAKDVTGQVGGQKKRYADLQGCWDACRASLADNGLAVTQAGYYEGGETWTLRTTLLHTSGQWIAGNLPILYSANKALTDMQALGSAITYARRYALCAIVGIVTEDDDGNAAGKNVRADDRQAPAAPAPEPARPAGLSAVQVDELHRLCKIKGVSAEALARRYGVKELATMGMRSYGECMVGFSQMKDRAPGQPAAWPEVDGEIPNEDEVRI